MTRYSSKHADHTCYAEGISLDQGALHIYNSGSSGVTR